MDHYSFTEPRGMEGWVGLVGWSHQVVTCQPPQIRRRSGNVCQPKTDVLTTEPHRQSQWLLKRSINLIYCFKVQNGLKKVAHYLAVVHIDPEWSLHSTYSRRYPSKRKNYTLAGKIGQISPNCSLRGTNSCRCHPVVQQNPCHPTWWSNLPPFRLMFWKLDSGLKHQSQ